MKSDCHPWQRFTRPWHVCINRASRRWLRRDGDLKRATFPLAPVFLDHSENVRCIHIACDDQCRFLGTIPAVEEYFRILILVGHVLDVLQESHRGVLIGVYLVGAVAHHFDQFRDRIGAVFVVLAQHCTRFGLEWLFVIRQILETISFDLEHGLQVFFCKRRVVIRVVVCGVGVLARAHLGEDRDILFRRICFGPAKHHVLEEMGESGLARLDLIA